MLSDKDFNIFQQLDGPCQLAKTDEDTIVSPLLVIILRLKTLGLDLKKTDELTNMTEKEDGNGKRNSQACRGSKMACCKEISEEAQVAGVRLKLDKFFTEGESLSIQSTQNMLLLMQPPALTHNHIYSPYLWKTLILCLELQYFNKDYIAD